ncbi:mediator of DNA damage checkpoint protein 1 [Seriola lalandi dorsalis]|uniref:Mediator of DNA damage checkpoint protein 1 n=1 Tax=Seriola lalandi dorsalis TaxID=1841481 RepID=A0A3B4YVJ3_SERLL|nr:mediator of DNA damage checkpoint protein 1 [Seriola lalandi dorsalis]
MDATQLISDSILETDEENEEEEENKRERPLAKLCILKNAHIPEADLPLFLGANVLGRDPNTCTLPLLAPSVSKQHATICISVYHRRGCHSEVDIEALVWDLGSMNGTRKGRLKLTPNVRYALSDGDSLVVADIPCQYVSCAVDSSQLGPRTPVSRNSGIKSRLPDALGGKGGDKSTDSRKCVNSGTKAGVSSLKTPVRASCLSFEKTPTQPQGTLVPESDSDSDGERGGGGDRRRNALVSDSESHKSSPTFSTFLSPTNKIVPESEDESPITPSSSTKNRPHRHVSFSKEETEVDVGGQLLEEKKALAIVHDSEEEGGREEERAAPEGKSEKSGPHLPVKQESSASLMGEDELPLSTAAVSTDSIPAFNMDSDTDMEGEEEGVASVGSVTLNTNQVNQPPNTVQFHMDSDTDVDEDEDIIDKAPKTVPSSDDKTKPPHVNSFIQPEGVTVDSDTDVDDDAAVSDAATEAKPMSFQRAHTADTASLMQPKDINLDSDTDVDEEEDRENGTNKPTSKMEETPTRLDIKPTGPESSPAAPHILHLDSDTDEEAIPVLALSEPVVVSAATESCTTADGGADILSDSDTDVDDNSPLVIPVVITTLSVTPGTTSEAFESDSNANTDVVGSSTPPAGDTANPQDLRVDSDTDVEDQEADGGQIPSLCREKTPGLLVPLLQNCSTPVRLSEGEVEVMETQAFLSPSSVPFRGAVAPVVGPVGLSSCSDSQEDEDFLVAETQSFILQTRDCQSNPPEDHTMDPTQAFGLEPSYENDEQSSREGSFQLGLSDSSHLQCQAQALAMESTQAFVSVDRNVNMEDTQAYAAISTADRTSAENDLNLEATQPYGKNEEPARCSVMSDKEGQVDLALEATQVYTSECHSDSESETDDDERKNITATAETQPFGFPTSCTPPVPHEEAAQPQQRPRGELLCTAETQPMSACDDEGSDDEDSIQSPGTRTAKPLQLEEQTQPLISSDLSIVETQPMHIGFAETQPMATSENEDTDDGDSIPIFRGRRAKPLQLEEEAQPLSSSEVSVTETQPMHIGVAETQPMGACEGEQSDEEDSILVPRKRKAKALQLEEEQTQPLTISEVSTVETQPLETQTSVQPERRRGRQSEVGTSGVNVRNKRGTMAGLREEEEQAVCSEPPKRRTRGKNKALTTTRGRRGKSNPDEDESEEEEEGEQARRARGKKSMRQQKHYEEEGEQCETEGSERAKNSSPIKEKQEEGDVANLTHHKSEKMERKEKEEQDRLLAENTARIRLEQERAEKERKEQEEKESYDRLQKEKDKKLEKERKEREEMERLEHEKAEREEKEKLDREEKERIEKEKKEQEEKERLEKVKKELEERLERERKEQERQATLEREAKEKEERERLEREAKERKERERLEKVKKELEERLERERKEQEHQARLEREAKEKEERERMEREAKEKEERERLEKEKETKEKQIKEQQGNMDEVNRRVPTRGRRAATRTMAAPTTEPEQDSTILTNDDVPARRTRSRSNSSNSVSSERSAASVNTQEGRGRGRGRGKKRTSEPPQVTIARGSSRRRTVAAGTTEQGNNDAFPQGVLSRSNSTNSLNSDISSYCVTSQRGRGSRQRERQRKTEPEPEPDSIPPVNSQSDQNSAPKPAARGRKSRKTEGSSNVAPQEDDQEKADSQQASTTRGQRRANANVSDSTAADEEDQPNQREGVGSEESPLPKRNARGRGQKAVKSETAEAPVAPAVSNVGETKDKRKGRKRELQKNIEGDSGSSSKISKGKEKYQTTEATEEEGKDESKEENPVQAKRRGRASTAQAKKNAKESPLGVEVKEESEEMEKDIVEKRGRGRPSAAQKKKKEEHEESGTSVSSMTRDAKVEAPEPQTPTTSASRKRQAPANSSPVAKTPRSSTASPAASGRQQAASQAYKVLFTGVVDETGERVLARLRGSIAKGVADMNCLVTDKVRRTVKFLCAVAKGIPIVTTHWLEKSGKAGSFLSPNAYVVKDPEQEKKFGFRLQESLRIASSQPLLQGYEIHVTKSVKPEPVQMKDIISCSGATFLPKMPSSPKPQTVVISCEEDWSLCGPAVAASLPVVTAEFILTGILQQKVDFQSHTLPAPVTNLQLTGGKGRGRKRT